MYADKLLKTNVFPQSVYDMRGYRIDIAHLIYQLTPLNAETAWYNTVVNSFGVPLDTRWATINVFRRVFDLIVSLFS